MPEDQEIDRIIVVTGNPISGFKLYGPFGCDVDAFDWADRRFEDEPCWLAYINDPEE